MYILMDKPVKINAGFYLFCVKNENVAVKHYRGIRKYKFSEMFYIFFHVSPKYTVFTLSLNMTFGYVFLLKRRRVEVKETNTALSVLNLLQ